MHPPGLKSQSLMHRSQPTKSGVATRQLCGNHDSTNNTVSVEAHRPLPASRLPGSLPDAASFLFPRREADGAFLPGFYRSHELANGIENGLELDVIFRFEGGQFA